MQLVSGCEVEPMADYRQSVDATREALRDTLQEIDDVSTEIDRLQKHLYDLECKAALYRSTIAPWKMLPDDMLMEIFERCLPPDGRAAMSITAAPLLLTLVCKHWREVALSTNSLWAKVHFVIPIYMAKGSPSAMQYERRIQALSSWLLRSGSLPITITLAKFDSRQTLALDWSYDRHGHQASRGLFPLLTIHASRLQYVSFPSHIQNGIASGVHGDSSDPILFPALEHISSPNESILAHWPLALQAPKLRSMSLMLRNISDSGMLQTGRWSQLTHLHIYDQCQSVTLLGMLSQCSSLLSLSVFCAPTQELNPLDSGAQFTSIPYLEQLYIQSGRPHVVLPHLQALKLDGMDINALTRALQVPALKHACCNEVHPPELVSEFSLALIPVVGHYGSIMLHSLSLNMGNIDAYLMDSLRAFLRTQDDLRALELNVHMWNGTEENIRSVEKLFEELTIRDSSPVRLPALEEFKLTGVFDGTVDGTLAFLRSRLAAPPNSGSIMRWAKVRIRRISVEMVRGRQWGQVDEVGVHAAHVTQECLIKMREFLKSSKVALFPLSVVISGTVRSFPPRHDSSDHTVDPFHGLDNRFQDRFQPLHWHSIIQGVDDGPEVSIEDFFHEDIMTSWLRESESSRDDETSDIDISL